jgi:hypothetical protein
MCMYIYIYMYILHMYTNGRINPNVVVEQKWMYHHCIILQILIITRKSDD